MTKTEKQAQAALSAAAAPDAHLPYPEFVRASGLKSEYVAELRRNGKLEGALVPASGGERVLNIGFAHVHLADELRYLVSLGLDTSAAAALEQQIRGELPIVWRRVGDTGAVPRTVIGIKYTNGETRTIPLRFLHIALIQLAQTAVQLQRRITQMKRGAAAARPKRQPSKRRKR